MSSGLDHVTKPSYKKQEDGQSDSEDINQQNICNKRSEKLNKPCQNGFCYCFTSDSDQHIRKRKPKTKSRKHICSGSSTGSRCSEEYSTSDSCYLDKGNKNYGISVGKSTEKKSSKKNYTYDQNKTNNYKLTAKTSLDKNENAPLIHIVQEIHADHIISEVKLNKKKMIKKKSSFKLKENIMESPKEVKYFTEETLKEVDLGTETEYEQFSDPVNIDDNILFDPKNVFKNKPKERHPKAGQLLKRRISDNYVPTPKYCIEPPKKPPRRFSETNVKSLAKNSKTITNFKEADIVLTNFLKQHGHNFENEPSHRDRKLFPLEELISSKETLQSSKVIPSCPSFSETESENSIESKIELAPRKVNEMLNHVETENIIKNFLPVNSKPKSTQIGWTIPPKQDIDTVDGLIKPPREVDFHNFAANMESKSTPIKSAEFVNLDQSETNNKAYTTPENKNKTDLSSKNKTDLSSSSTLKPKESTCDFLKNSAHKIVNLVSRINSKDKDKFRNKSLQRDVSCQTSDPNLHIALDNVSNDTSSNKKARFSLQLQPKTRFFNSPKKNNYAEDFDFNRKINSPKNERTSQRRLSFSPKKIMKNFSQMPPNYNVKQQKKFEFYKSYQSEYNGDFSLNLMNDILLNIKAKLEASDLHATNVFREVERNDRIRKMYSKENDECKSSGELSELNSHSKVISASADVHTYDHYNNNPGYQKEIYSEIEEERLIFNGSPSSRSLNEISHFYANNDPNSEYAEINKLTKFKLSKIQKSPITNKSLNSLTKTNCQRNNNSMHNCKIYDYDVANDGLSEMSSEKEVCVQNSEFVSERNNEIVKDDNTYQKIFQVLNPNKINRAESIVNLSANSLKSSVGGIVEDQTKPVKELVDYFEYSLCQNKTCNQNHSVSYESLNGSTKFQTNEISNTFQELEVLSDQEGDYYEILDKEIRSESCPLPAQSPNRISSIGNNSFLTCVSADNKIKTTSQDKKVAKYSVIKGKFRKSIKKGKSFFKKNIRNYSFNDTINSTNSYDPWEQSNLGISTLFVENNDTCWQKQLEKAVFICRKLPVLESSLEAVEAERLLLYSTLKFDNLESNFCDRNSVTETPSTDYESWICIEEFELPIQSDIEFIDFFNFFYVGVFSNGNKIISTNYAEKRDKLIVFRNCNIKFENITCNTKIKCDLYVLRLRKVLNTKISKEQFQAKMEEINGFSDVNEQLLSRFKFQGSFQLLPHNFTPFKMDDTCDRDFKLNKFCLHSVKTINLPTEIDGERSLILNYVKITAKLEIIFNKFKIEGFLNVRSITSEHNWNKRWCKVDNFDLLYYDYPQDCNSKPPIFVCNLTECINEKISVASQEICPRPKSFCVKVKNNLANSIIDLYFSADNQNDLNHWLNGLNNILSFKKIWM